MIRIAAILVLVGSLAPAGVAQEKFAPNKKVVPQQGWKYTQSGAQELSQKTKSSSGDRVQNHEEKSSQSHEATVELLEVSGEDWTRARIAVKSATSNGQENGLAGKSFIATGEDGSRTFALEGEGELTESQAAFLSGAFDQAKSDKPLPQDIFFPEGAKAVGETWDVSLEMIRRLFDLAPGDVDAEKSKATCTLVAVTEERGARFGVFEFDVDLAIEVVPGSQTPLSEGSLTMSGSIAWPLEAQTPTMAVSSTMRSRGKGKMMLEGKALDIEFEVEFQSSHKVRPAE